MLKGTVVSCEAEVVIVGAGISGGALATVLSRSGISVLVLERSLAHRDRVRGEYLAAWGVEEAQRLGLLDVLVAAGGHYTPLSVPYGEGVAPAIARARALDLRKLLPSVQGALTFGHPRASQALDDAAEAAGATVLRGVERIMVTSGERPTISFMIEGQVRELRPRLIVGADGRGSDVARQIGARVETEPVHHLLAGLLVDGVDAWPDEEFSIGTEGDVMFFVFPQGNGRARLYLGYGLNFNADAFPVPAANSVFSRRVSTVLAARQGDVRLGPSGRTMPRLSQRRYVDRRADRAGRGAHRETPPVTMTRPSARACRLRYVMRVWSMRRCWAASNGQPTFSFPTRANGARECVACALRPGNFRFSGLNSPKPPASGASALRSASPPIETRHCRCSFPPRVRSSCRTTSSSRRRGMR